MHLPSKSTGLCDQGISVSFPVRERDCSPLYSTLRLAARDLAPGAKWLRASTRVKNGWRYTAIPPHPSWCAGDV